MSEKRDKWEGEERKKEESFQRSALSAAGEAFPSALAEAETRSSEQVEHQFSM